MTTKYVEQQEVEGQSQGVDAEGPEADPVHGHVFQSYGPLVSECTKAVHRFPLSQVIYTFCGGFYSVLPLEAHRH